MAGNCEAHPFDEATGRCRSCGHAFCAECLVFTHGESKPPYCIPCAFTAAGVRSTARRGRVGDEERSHAMAGRVLVGLVVAGGAAVAAVPVAHALGF